MPEVFCVPAKDIYQNTVKIALQIDGWTITHDPFPIWVRNVSSVRKKESKKSLLR
jgi:hypothetical protein